MLILPPLIDLIHTITEVQRQPMAGVWIIAPSLTWIVIVILIITNDIFDGFVIINHL